MSWCTFSGLGTPPEIHLKRHHFKIHILQTPPRAPPRGVKKTRQNATRNKLKNFPKRHASRAPISLRPTRITASPSLFVLDILLAPCRTPLTSNNSLKLYVLNNKPPQQQSRNDVKNKVILTHPFLLNCLIWAVFKHHCVVSFWTDILSFICHSEGITFGKQSGGRQFKILCFTCTKPYICSAAGQQ